MKKYQWLVIKKWFQWNIEYHGLIQALGFNYRIIKDKNKYKTWWDLELSRLDYYFPRPYRKWWFFLVEPKRYWQIYKAKIKKK